MLGYNKMKFSREMMIETPEMTRELLDICKKEGNKYVEIDQEPTEDFKIWCRYRKLKIHGTNI
mgnify:CR=1 FL=1